MKWLGSIIISFGVTLAAMLILYPSGVVGLLWHSDLPRHFVVLAVLIFIAAFFATAWTWKSINLSLRPFLPLVVILSIVIWLMRDIDRVGGVIRGSLGSFIIALLVWSIITKLHQNRKIAVLSKKLANPWLIVLVFSIVYSVLAIMRHVSLHSEAADLGIFTQEIYKYAHFQGIFNTIKGQNIFADHFSPFLMLLAPLWWLWPSASMLLVVQAVALSFGAWVVYYIAIKMLNDRLIAWCLAVAFVLAPSIQAPVAADFHEIIFVPAALLLLFYFQQRQKWLGYWIIFALALLIKENVATYLIAWSLFYGFTSHRWKQAWIGIGVSAVYFLIVLKGVIPHYTAGAAYQYLNMGPLGSTPGEIIKNSLIHPQLLVHQFFHFDTAQHPGFAPDLKIFTQVSLLAVFGFLPILAPLALIFAAPMLIEQFLLDFPYHWGLTFHYSTPITVVLVIATLFGLARFGSNRKLQQILAVFILVSSIAYSLQQRTFITDIFRRSTYQVTTAEHEAVQVAGRIPANASVATNSSLLPHIAGRNDIIRWPGYYGEDGAIGFKNKPLVQDYAIISFAGSHWIWKPEEVVAQMDAIIHAPGYGLIDISDDGQTVLVKRGATANAALLQKWAKIKPTLQ